MLGISCILFDLQFKTGCMVTEPTLQQCMITRTECNYIFILNMTAEPLIMN